MEGQSVAALIVYRAIEMMDDEWDTFGLFQSLLDNFESLLTQAVNERRAGHADPPETNLAIVGFSRSCSINGWRRDHAQLIRDRLQSDLSHESLEWYEETEPAVVLFSCLVLGTLLGLREVGQIDDAGFMLGEAHLPAFTAGQNESIHSKLLAAQIKQQSLLSSG